MKATKEKPAGDPTVLWNVRLPLSLRERLNHRAAELNVSGSDLTRRFITCVVSMPVDDLKFAITKNDPDPIWGPLAPLMRDPKAGKRGLFEPTEP